VGAGSEGSSRPPQIGAKRGEKFEQNGKKFGQKRKIEVENIF